MSGCGADLGVLAWPWPRPSGVLVAGPLPKEEWDGPDKHLKLSLGAFPSPVLSLKPCG